MMTENSLQKFPILMKCAGGVEGNIYSLLRRAGCYIVGVGSVV